MRRDHAAYSRRAKATKSSADRRLRPIWEPGPGVICGATAPDITLAGERLARPRVICGEPSPSLLAAPAPRRRANLFIARQFHPEGRLGMLVISGANAPHITSGGLRPCPGRYPAQVRRISPASRERRPTPSSSFAAVCRTSETLGANNYPARMRRIISNTPADKLVC